MTVYFERAGLITGTATVDVAFATGTTAHNLQGRFVTRAAYGADPDLAASTGIASAPTEMDFKYVAATPVTVDTTGLVETLTGNNDFKIHYGFFTALAGSTKVDALKDLATGAKTAKVVITCPASVATTGTHCVVGFAKTAGTTYTGLAIEISSGTISPVTITVDAAVATAATALAATTAIYDTTAANIKYETSSRELSIWVDPDTFNFDNTAKTFSDVHVIALTTGSNTGAITNANSAKFVKSSFKASLSSASILSVGLSMMLIISIFLAFI